MNQYIAMNQWILFDVPTTYDLTVFNISTFWMNFKYLTALHQALMESHGVTWLLWNMTVTNSISRNSN